MLPAMHQAWAETTGALWSSRTMTVSPFSGVVGVTPGGKRGSSPLDASRVMERKGSFPFAELFNVAGRAIAQPAVELRGILELFSAHSRDGDEFVVDFHQPGDIDPARNAIVIREGKLVFFARHRQSFHDARPPVHPCQAAAAIFDA